MASDKGDSATDRGSTFHAGPEESPTPASRTDDVQLCGYLNKLSSTSLVKTYKQRWFVFSENNCKLYYYRKPGDLQPLGEIDVKSASFYLDVTNWEKPGVFVIRTPQRGYNLEAKDRQAALYWLQELQRFRRNHSQRRNLNLKYSRTTVDTFSPQQVTSGLLHKDLSVGEASGKEGADGGLLLSHVECPTGVVGEHTAQQQSPSHSSTILSNLRHSAAIFQKRQRSRSGGGKAVAIFFITLSGR